MRTNIETATTTIVFESANVRELLAANPQICTAVWETCMGLVNAKINVFPSERIDGAADWHMTITSPSGRRSFEIHQATMVSQVHISKQPT